MKAKRIAFADERGRTSTQPTPRWLRIPLAALAAFEYCGYHQVRSADHVATGKHFWIGGLE